MRIFTGLMVAPALWEAVGAVQTALGCGRPVAEENLHLTLVFAGEASLEAARRWHEELEAVRMQPFVLELAGLELIGPAERPELLALGVRPSAALEALQAKVAQAARRAGLELPRRRFRPHVTLARFGQRFDAAQAARVGRLLQAKGDVVLPEWQVERFALLRSHLSHAGADYEVLAEYPEPDAL